MIIKIHLANVALHKKMYHLKITRNNFSVFLPFWHVTKCPVLYFPVLLPLVFVEKKSVLFIFIVRYSVFVDKFYGLLGFSPLIECAQSIISRLNIYLRPDA